MWGGRPLSLPLPVSAGLPSAPTPNPTPQGTTGSSRFVSSQADREPLERDLQGQRSKQGPGAGHEGRGPTEPGEGHTGLGGLRRKPPHFLIWGLWHAGSHVLG